MDLMLAVTLFAVVGALIGFLAGLVGIGGGLVIVPALVYWFRAAGLPLAEAMLLATGTSLAAIGGTCLLAAIAHRKSGTLELRAVRPLIVPVVIGALGGPWLALHTPGVVLQSGLVALYAYSGWALMVRSRSCVAPIASAKGACLGSPFARAASGLTAAVAGMAGIAGNTLLIPLLSRAIGLQFRQAVGIASALAVPLCFVGSLSYAAQPEPAGAAAIASGIVGAVYLPAGLGLAIGSALTVRAGTALGKRLASTTLERLFAALLFAAAAKLAIG